MYRPAGIFSRRIVYILALSVHCSNGFPKRCLPPLASRQPPPVHIYTLAANLSSDLIVISDGEPPEWREQYDLDVFLLRALEPYNVPAPEAKVFFIPALPTRFLHRVFHQTGNLDLALRISADYMEETLAAVRNTPMWQRCNGCDHFLVITHDFGRCSHRTYPSGSAGEMFVVQYEGDLVQSKGTPEFCYRPQRDIVVPVFLHGDLKSSHTSEADLKSTDRSISVFLPFAGERSPPGLGRRLFAP